MSLWLRNVEKSQDAGHLWKNLEADLGALYGFMTFMTHLMIV